MLLLTAALLLLAWAASAHQAPSGWEYGRECCSNRDCAPVPAPRVTPEGLVFHLPAGSHPAAARQPLTVVVPHRHPGIHPSGDDRWHLCVHPELRAFYCAYRPPAGF
ncbi:MAG: hypothetical protein N2688_00180 [Burkholderiaceae bacterium]|nr:hypothetical protein [Burkholderiaceae bacterium]